MSTRASRVRRGYLLGGCAIIASLGFGGLADAQTKLPEVVVTAPKEKPKPHREHVRVALQDEKDGLGKNMAKLSVALLSFIFVVSLPQTGGATNYSEHKKFGPSSETGKVFRRAPAWLKEGWNCYYLDKACGVHNAK
jgi:hypothetical protein